MRRIWRQRIFLSVTVIMVITAIVRLIFHFYNLHDVLTPSPSEKPIIEKNQVEDVRHSKTIAFEPVEGDRVAAARKRSENEVRNLFKKSGLPYPADEIFIRTFKREGELEVWARMRMEPFRRIATYGITAESGGPGPKRREGDGQVPEGFYEVDRFNPKSNFHLSLGLNYPNASDRILSDRARPGTDIFIHGNAVSIGCMPLGDDRVEEVYLMSLDSKKRPIPVHNFPARMQGEDWLAWRNEQIQSRPELASFWEQLQPGFDFFEATHQLPEVKVLSDGSYQIRGADQPD